MSETETNTNIEIFHEYLKNFSEDIIAMENTSSKIEEWVKRGLRIEAAQEPLQTQIIEWKQIMEQLINDFKNTILKLKQLDDRINSDISVEIEDIGGTYLERFSYLYDIYKNLFENLKSDTLILNNIQNEISNYQQLGVTLGNATESITQQITNINDGINVSLEELNTHIETIKTHSKKILTTEELNANAPDEETINNNDYLAVYATAGSDQNSFLLYMNMNQDIAWDPVVDGTNMLQCVDRAKVDDKSPIYNEYNGVAAYTTGNTETYKYLYYGIDRNNMIKEEIDDTTFGIQYEDRHGYQYTVNTFYKPMSDISHIEAFRNLMSSNGIEYNGGAQTTVKLYIVYSKNEISDFSNIAFRG